MAPHCRRRKRRAAALHAAGQSSTSPDTSDSVATVDRPAAAAARGGGGGAGEDAGGMSTDDGDASAGDHARAAMHLYGLACDRGLERGSRWLALRAAWQQATLVFAEGHSCPRRDLLLFARIAADLGERARAVKALHILVARGLPPPAAQARAREGTEAAAAAAAAGETREEMWARPFLAPRRAESELLHESMGATPVLRLDAPCM
jgi:hypothetical protein